jgi:transcription elongation GreA/GreB family factor
MVDKLAYKKKLLDKCLEEHVKLEEHNKEIMNEAQETANESEQTQDLYDSYRTQLLQKRDMFAKQLQKIIEERIVLERIDVTELHDKVKFGSVVVTDKQKMFISIGMGKIQFDNEEFIIISPMVPIFKAMEGKKKGDKFRCNQNEFTILDVF